MAEPAVKLLLSTPAELIEAVPYLLGFHPRDSLVALALYGPRSRLACTMRLDLPAADADRHGDMADLVAAHVAHASADRAVLVVYGDTGEVLDGLPYGRLIAAVSAAVAARGIDVLDALYVGAERWWSYTCATPGCCPSDGTPIAADGSSSVAATAAYAGLVALPDREALERSLDKVGFLAAQGMQQALDRAEHELARRASESGGRPALRAESLHLLTAAVDRDAQPSDDEAARLVLGLEDVAVRDECCGWTETERAEPAQRMWRQLARRATPPYDAAPFFLVGWFAWLGGNATLARMAVDRCLDSDPTYSLGLLLEEALDGALDPALIRQRW